MSGSKPSPKNSEQITRLSKFSHIYVENQAKGLPLTQKILTKFKSRKPIYIDSYKEIFNRKKQNWRESKISQKLIIAVKSEPFLHRASDIIQTGSESRFYYTTPILNCVFDCDYCFLQGKFSSPHAVIFVNSNQFEDAVDQELLNGSLILAPSYETDLLAFENIVPLTERWIEFARSRENLELELRSKSGEYKLLKHIQPSPNVILTWTVSPEVIVSKYERGTSGLIARIKAINDALCDGWKVRVSIDPVLAVDNWQKIYGDFLNELSKLIPLSKLHDIWIGTFRMNNQFLKNIQSSRDDSDILYYPFVTKNNVAMYPETIQIQLKEIVSNALPANIKSLVYE